MSTQINPFALVRASDYTDEQINSLWVELGPTAIDTIIEPRSRISKYILGGKGTGKTHLLRYHSYPASRLRSLNDSGLSILIKQKFLGIFLRATGVDAARFEASSEFDNKWQLLFGVYLELRLVEGVLDALCDIKLTSPNDNFDDTGFLQVATSSVIEPTILRCKSINDYRDWIINERRRIDDAVNNAAFAGTLDVRISFSIGALCQPVSHAIGRWNSSLSGLPLIFLIDEIENFSASQQQVVNSLIRYGEGLTTFRVTGRLYSRKSLATLADSEENREGAEFKTTFLDDILRSYRKYPDFARRFVAKRLSAVGLLADGNDFISKEFNPHSIFEKISSNDYYSSAIKRLGLDFNDNSFINSFSHSLDLATRKYPVDDDYPSEVALHLTQELPTLLQKLNLLLFCKKFKKNTSSMRLAEKIRLDSLQFLEHTAPIRNYYSRAYGHWASDLFAQLCKESKKGSGVPYAGFEAFIKMSSGNPRNLLIILGRAYEIATFKEINFIHGPELPISIQNEAVLEAARFMFDRDTNYGSQSDKARDAVARLASILKTARYSLNIPEVSPLAVSFASDDLNPTSKSILDSALNYSFIFEISDGRPDRNIQRLNRKIQLNPILSPRWGLPISRRGDISLGRDLINAIFDPHRQSEFDLLLKGLSSKWNNPFKSTTLASYQAEMF